jgi:hypothetical protein
MRISQKRVQRYGKKIIFANFLVFFMCFFDIPENNTTFVTHLFWCIAY